MEGRCVGEVGEGGEVWERCEGRWGSKEWCGVRRECCGEEERGKEVV